jgi:hypothetical protein
MWNRNNSFDYEDPSGFIPAGGEGDDRIGLLARIASMARIYVEKAEERLISSGSSRGQAAAAVGTNAADGIVRDVYATLGRTGVMDDIAGTATPAEADAAGARFAGPGATWSADGRVLTSRAGPGGGTRTYRPPQLKKTGRSKGKIQANFEFKDPNGDVTKNVHVNIQN